MSVYSPRQGACALAVFRDAYEVNTDGGDVALSVRIICKPQQQARLSDTRVSDEEQLEEIVVSWLRIHVSLGPGSTAKGFLWSPSK